jgi:hypothetical protein
MIDASALLGWPGVDEHLVCSSFALSLDAKAEEVKPAPRGVMRKEMTDINISSVPAGMPAAG